MQKSPTNTYRRVGSFVPEAVNARVVVAHRWFKNGDHPEDFTQDRPALIQGEVTTVSGQFAKHRDWEGGVVRRYNSPSTLKHCKNRCPVCGNIFDDHGFIDTPDDGGYAVCPGDWIITGENGIYHRIASDEFELAYEPVI